MIASFYRAIRGRSMVIEVCNKDARRRESNPGATLAAQGPSA
jgi:hypothetical protein